MESGKGSVGVLRIMVQIEEIKEGTYREVATGAKDTRLVQLLEALAEAKRRHLEIFSALLDQVVEGETTLAESPGLDAVTKRGSWLLRNLEKKRETAPTIRSRMLVIEFLQRTEEESLDLHKSLREHITGNARQDLDSILVGEKKDVEKLRQLAVKTLTFFGI